MGKKGRSRRPRACGLLLVDKPAGATSHDVVQWVRRELGERAVGHCGTLDPAATGLLVICVGPATRFVEALSADDKHYEARFVLGEATDTGDADGELIARSEPEEALRERLPALVESMVGAQQLPPPAYSAIRVDGVRAHRLARAGQAPELEARPMSLFAVSEIRVAAPGEGMWVDARLHLSKGSYVRSFAEWLGSLAGHPCRLDALRRVQSGHLEVADPACVRGLCVDTLPPREGQPADAKPRVRVSADPERWPPGALMAALRDPVPATGAALVEVAGAGEAAQAGLARLAQGQRLALASPEARALSPEGSEEGAAWLVRGPAEADGAHRLIWVEARAGQGGRGPSLAPVRQVRLWPPGPVEAEKSGSSDP